MQEIYLARENEFNKKSHPTKGGFFLFSVNLF
jgi:hypothetical protein